MKRTAICLLLLASTAAAGCRSIADRWDAKLVTLRGGRAAERSWRENLAIYADVPNRDSFAEGYKSGYAHALAGRDSNQPPFPSHAVGSDASGRGRNIAVVQSWLDGFSHGALVASHDRAQRQQGLHASSPQAGGNVIHEASGQQNVPVPPLPPAAVEELELTEASGRAANTDDATLPATGPVVRYSATFGTH